MIRSPTLCRTIGIPPVQFGTNGENVPFWVLGRSGPRRLESSLALLALGFRPFVLASGMLRANVLFKCCIALAFVIPSHLVDRVALRRIIIVERPGAFRARPTVPVRGLHPNHASHIHCLCPRFPGRLGNRAKASRSRTESGARDRRSLASTVARSRTFSATATGTCSKCVFCICMTAASFGCLHRNKLPVIRGESLVSLRVNAALPQRTRRRDTRHRVTSPMLQCGECMYLCVVLLYVTLNL